MQQLITPADPFIFLGPFSMGTWLAGVSLWLFYGVVLWFISQMSKKMSREESSSAEKEFTLRQALQYFSIGSLQFGPDVQLRSTGGKILQNFWSFFTLIFVATYTANLAAIFSQEAYSRPLSSIEDIPHSNYTIFAKG